jgi:phage gpG-like protein
VARAIYESEIESVKAKVYRANDVALGRVALEASRLIRASMPGAGASASDSLGRGTGQNDTFTPSSPGNPPGVRSGELQRSIAFEQEQRGRWVVSTNWPYAMIHEYGGVINHPGGTPYIIVDNGRAVFITKSKAQQLESEGKHVGYTKPHTITMPARPYFKPTIEANTSNLRKKFAEVFRREMGA